MKKTTSYRRAVKPWSKSARKAQRRKDKQQFQRKKHEARVLRAPVHELPGQVSRGKGIGGPRRQWDEVCPNCRNERYVRGISSWLPCPRCNEPENENPAGEPEIGLRSGAEGA